MPPPRTFFLRHVTLVTRAIDGILPFYRDVLGLVATQPDPTTLDLHFAAGAPAVITFRENPDAAEPVRVAGLFHIALLVPDRPTLAAALARLIEYRQPLEGLSDHGVSEAIYLSDPDGNGLEIYCDRAPEVWPRDGDRVVMFTAALDHRVLLQEVPIPPPKAPLAHATLGHLHLQVSDLPAAKKFYTTDLGLAVRQDSYADAVFMAADGYHHHVAINTWNHSRPRGTQPVTGLVDFTVETSRVAVARTLADPDGFKVKLEPLTRNPGRH